MGLFGKKHKKMFFYCKAKVVKEHGFNYLKYELNYCGENTKFVEQFDAGEIVKIYVKRTGKR